MSPYKFSVSRNSFYTILFIFVYVLVYVNINEILAQDTEICPSYSCPKIICDLKQKKIQNFCRNVQCVGIKVEDCPPGSIYEENLSMCGCCAGCAKYLNVGDHCERYPIDPKPDPTCDYPFCPIVMNRCTPGLVCPLNGTSINKCTVPPGSQESPKCHDKRALSLNGDLHWIPRCETDGTFSSKQCKGTFHSGTCFCVDRDGNRIFGTEFYEKAENQTCACSRQAHELRENGYIASIHCTADGNYEPLQCDTDSGLCYCVDPLTGKTNGAVLPENQWKELPCFSLNLTNFNPDGSYLRMCESEWAIARKIAIEASLHGLTVLSGQRITCDFDGSYAPVQNIDTVTKCVRKDGGLIANNRDTEDLRDTNCQCVRDEISSSALGIPFLKQCDVITGNYDTISPIDQTKPSSYRCVDRDGFFFGDTAEETFQCCFFQGRDDIRNCTNESPEVRSRCYNPNSPENEGKIHPCSFWPT